MDGENSDNISVCLNAADGKLAFDLNIIIVIIIIIILAPASTLPAGYWIEIEKYGFARGNSEPVLKKNVLLGTECVRECYRIPSLQRD